MNQYDLEIKERGPLLDANGHLTKEGWARKLILDYDRKAIKGGALRIKEWDYYLIVGPGYAVALTIDDNSYMWLDSVSLLVLDPEKAMAVLGRNPQTEKVWEHTNSPMGLFSMGKRNFPPTSEKGDIFGNSKKHALSFEIREAGTATGAGTATEAGTATGAEAGTAQARHRILKFHMDDFMDGKPIDGEITLTEYPGDTIVMATPYNDKATAFYYNQKINCMPAEGWTKFDGVTYKFQPEDSFATLDWGRGVWTYKNTWYWGNANGTVNGKRFGFNIGYGFGDNKATENAVFYDGKLHKLSEVSFNIPMKPKKFVTRGSCCGTEAGMAIDTKDLTEDYTAPWTFTSDDGRFEMDFTPVLDRASNTDAKLIQSDQHQVFGYFNGTVTLDDGEVLQIKDLLGFAEKVYNKW